MRPVLLLARLTGWAKIVVTLVYAHLMHHGYQRSAPDPFGKLDGAAVGLF